MRRLIYILPCLFLMGAIIPATAQFSVGLRAAGNLSNVAMEYDDEDDNDLGDTENRFGIAIGLVAEIGISEMFAIQPELHFSQHGFQVSGSDSEDILGEIWKTEYEAKARFNYIQIPILAKVKLGSESFGFNIFAGPHIGMGIGKVNYEDSYSISIDGVSFDSDSSSEDTSWKDAMLKTIDFGVTGGVGISIPAGPGFFGVDARYQLGLADFSDDSEFTIMNRNIQFGLSYLLPLGM